jgi:hypothetical protein
VGSRCRPTHGIEHGLAAHALKPGEDVGVGVGEDVADVQDPLTVGGGVSME